MTPHKPNTNSEQIRISPAARARLMELQSFYHAQGRTEVSFKQLASEAILGLKLPEKKAEGEK